MAKAPLRSDLIRLTRGEVSTDGAILDELSFDYGGTRQGQPQAVVRPATPGDVGRLVRYAYERDLPITPRAGGYSFAGQSLTDGGIVLDMRGLDGIDLAEPERGWFRAQAGVEWHRIVEAAVPLGVLPPVLTSYLRTSVGGTLSAAGFGMSSFRHGTQIDHCLELEVVGPTGDVVRCSEEENADLFSHALGGFGQFGVITGARLRLRPALPRTRTYFLIYDDLTAHLADQAKLVDEGRVQFIDGMLRPCYIGQRAVGGRRVPFQTYFYPLNVTFEAKGDGDWDDDRELSGLRFSKLVHVEDLGLADFLLLGHRDEEPFSRRVAQVFSDVLVPWPVLEEFLRAMETHVIPRIVHVEHTVLWPMTRATLTRPMLRVPDVDRMMGVGLYCRVPSAYAASTLQVSRAYVDLALRLGGTYYLTGSVRLDEARYASQFGERWATIQEVKRRYDPKGLFNPGFFPWTDE